MSVSLVILILYIIALFGISWFAKKRSEGNAENYALAGRRLSAPLIAVTIIGLAVGGASTIGVSEHAFRVGLSAGWYTIAWAIGAIVMGIFMAKKYREQNITTISELIERHHGTNAVILGVFCQIVIQLVIISLQYIAGGSILHAIMPDVLILNRYAGQRDYFYQYHLYRRYVVGFIDKCSEYYFDLFWGRGSYLYPVG